MILNEEEGSTLGTVVGLGVDILLGYVVIKEVGMNVFTLDGMKLGSELGNTLGIIVGGLDGSLEGIFVTLIDGNTLGYCE